MHRRLVLSLAGLLLSFVGLFSYQTLIPDSADRSSCTNRGSIDTQAAIDLPGTEIRIAGWAYHWIPWNPVREIVVVANGKTLIRYGALMARPDVARALTQCKYRGNSGFDIGIPASKIPSTATTLEIRAVKFDGESFPIGAVGIRFAAPAISVDSIDPLVPNGQNMISGWAYSPSGSVRVRISFESEAIWQGIANLHRQDVGNVFSNWSGADKSGFEAVIPTTSLPRGGGATTIEFLAPDGGKRVTPGPRLENLAPIGKVLAKGGNRFVKPRSLQISAFIRHESGIASAAIETEQGQHLRSLSLRQAAVPLDRFPDPRFPKQGKRVISPMGNIYFANLNATDLPDGLNRLVVRAKSNQGTEAILPGPLVYMGPAATQSTCAGSPLVVHIPVTASILHRGFPELIELRQIAEGPCVRFGIALRVEYLRTTHGRRRDYQFDPNFSERLRGKGNREMTTASLRDALAVATRLNIPVRVTLDGGVWADSRFSIPEYDVVDHLETDDLNVQWNQFGKTESDDALAGLAGSTENPQLARMMSLNVYNSRYLTYKKRNLQAAARLIATYNRSHPGNPVTINLDPDEYINPWFYLTQWYDYNPLTLRQFREWLIHSGPYDNGGTLAGRGHVPRMGLAEINKLAKASWLSIDEIDPPRESPDYSSAWHQIWTQFKRHLIAQHYDDLARWVVEAGMKPGLVLTSQTFIQADVAVQTNDRATGWPDEAGVSIMGAKPTHGHLGAILYGAASRDVGQPRSGRSLQGNIQMTDPNWSVVEMHPAVIARPDRMPSHEDSYKTMLSIINHGARGITPMWGSYAGDQLLHPTAFRSYDVFEQSPVETQIVWWLRELGTQPAGGFVWPFGNMWTRSDDGWKAETNSSLSTEFGAITVIGPQRKEILSPSIAIPIGMYRLEIRSGQPLQRGTVNIESDQTGYTSPLTRLRPDSGGNHIADLQFQENYGIHRLRVGWYGQTSTAIQSIRLFPIQQP